MKLILEARDIPHLCAVTQIGSDLEYFLAKSGEKYSLCQEVQGKLIPHQEIKPSEELVLHFDTLTELGDFCWGE